MIKTFTHMGVQVGSDNRTSDSYKRNIYLRETKNFFVTRHGEKYNKEGIGLGDWPMYRLTEITPLPIPIKINCP